MKAPALLGQYVRNRLDGVGGICYGFALKSNGNIQLAYATGGNDSKDHTVDIQHIEAVRAPRGFKPLPITKPLPHSYDIALGSEVEDLASGFKGLALDHFTFANGCVYYGVHPKSDKPNVLPESVSFDVNRLKVIGKGISESLPVNKTADAKPVKPTGGPPTKMRFA